MAKKANGNGIREVSPGKFVATMYDPRVKGGTKHVGTFTVGSDYPTRKDARKAAEDAKRAEEELRDLQLKQPSEDESCASFAKRYPTDYQGVRVISTVEHQRDRLRAFIEDFGDRPLREITPLEAHAWTVGGIVPPQIRAIAKTWKGAKTLPDGDVEVPHHRSNHQVVNTMYNQAVRTFRGTSPLPYGNPFADLKLPKSKGRAGQSITILTEAELEMLVATAVDVYGEYGRHFGALIKAQAWTGLRPGEAWAEGAGRGPKVNFIDFARGEIDVRWQVDKRNRLRPPKHCDPGQGRTVYLLPPAEDALKTALGFPPRTEGPLWLTKRDASPMSGRTLGYYWDKLRSVFWAQLPDERRSLIAEKDGGPEPGKIAIDFDFYELRHFFGTQLAEMGNTAPEIADQMGHKDGGALALRLYIHPRSESTKRNMRERYDEHVRRQKAREQTG